MHPESGSRMTSMAMAVGLTKGAGEFMPLFPPRESNTSLGAPARID